MMALLQIRDCQPEHCYSTRSHSAADRKALLANRRLGPRCELTQEPKTLNGLRMKTASTVTQFLVPSRVMAGCRDGTVEISV